MIKYILMNNRAVYMCRKKNDKIILLCYSPNGTNSLNTLETPLLDADSQVPPLDLDPHTNAQSPSNFIHNSELELHRIEDESKSLSPKNNDDSEGILSLVHKFTYYQIIVADSAHFSSLKDYVIKDLRK